MQLILPLVNLTSSLKPTKINLTLPIKHVLVIPNLLAKSTAFKHNTVKSTRVGNFMLLGPKFLVLVHPNHLTLSSML